MTDNDDQTPDAHFPNLSPGSGGHGGLDHLAKGVADAEDRMVKHGGRASVARSIASKMEYEDARAEIERQQEEQQQKQQEDGEPSQAARQDEPRWKVIDHG